jgi:HAD superfamily hydrolase (TIGR01509 family)
MWNKYQISLIIFDMDGLMFETETLAIQTWTKAGRTVGIEISEQIVLESIGLDIHGAEKVFKKYFGDNFPYYQLRDLRLAYTENYIEENGVPVKKGLYKLLKFLNETSLSKAVATSTERERAEKLLEIANIKDEFDVIICGDDVLKGKPEPDIFLEAARKLNCKTDECLVLEDSLNGILAASKANMRSIFVSDKETLKSFEGIQGIPLKEFTSLFEVNHFLEELNL